MAGQQIAAPEAGRWDPLDIVFISPFAPYPPIHGGAVRMYNILKRLGPRHRVTLLTYVEDEGEIAGVRALEAYCRRAEAFVRRPDLRRYDRFGADPLCRVEFESDDMRRAIGAALADNPDVVQIEYTQMGHYASPSPRYVSVLTEHDVSFVSLFRRFRARRWSRAKLKDGLHWLRMFNYEIALCRRFDLVLTVTRREEMLLRSYVPDVDVSSTAPTGVDLSYFRPVDSPERDRHGILFLGNFRHPPNVDAALFLGREIVPLLKAIQPSAHTTIAGPHPPEEVSDLARDSAVSVVGYVEDLRELYARHAVFVAPIRIGAGVRVKILEAMAAGVPVVTTSIGAEGIDCVPGRDLIIVDNPGGLAEAIARVLADRELATSLARSARLTVEAFYDWDVIARNLEGLYWRHVIAKRGARAAGGNST